MTTRASVGVETQVRLREEASKGDHKAAMDAPRREWKQISWERLSGGIRLGSERFLCKHLQDYIQYS